MNKAQVSRIAPAARSPFHPSPDIAATSTRPRRGLLVTPSPRIISERASIPMRLDRTQRAVRLWLCCSVSGPGLATYLRPYPRVVDVLPRRSILCTPAQVRREPMEVPVTRDLSWRFLLSAGHSRPLRDAGLQPSHDHGHFTSASGVREPYVSLIATAVTQHLIYRLGPQLYNVPGRAGRYLALRNGT